MSDRKLTPEEAELWRRYNHATKPLRKEQGMLTTGLEKTNASLKTKNTQINAKPRLHHKHNTSLAPPLKPILPSLVALDGATSRQLRRGKKKIEGRIDLHGMRQGEAHDALIRFILFSRHHGRRCVLVITGKGQRKTNHEDHWRDVAPGVLRRSVPDWLRGPSLLAHVVGFEPAQPRHGGSGALYVILKTGQF